MAGGTRKPSRQTRRGTFHLNRPLAAKAGHLDRQQQGRYFGAARSGEGVFRPPAARGAAGHDTPHTKPLPQFGSGVFELRERFDGDACRLMYVVAIRKAIYVLHAFMKKSKSGTGLPKPDEELTELRLKRARTLDAEEWP